MLMRIEPLRELDRMSRFIPEASQRGTWSRPAAMPVDTYRNGDEFVVVFDVPGVAPDAIDIQVERNVLTVRAERRPPSLDKDARVQLSERLLGVFSRQLLLDDTLDTGRIEASCDNGVLVVRIPVAEQAKPRKVAIGTVSGEGGPKAINA